MKKRVISIMLTLVMLLTSVAFAVPANAVEAEDLSALVASALAESDNATVTLTANVTSSALISVPAGKTLTIEGNGKTYTAGFGIKAVDGGALKVKNLNVVLTSTTVGYAESQAGGDLSFEGCTFSVTAATTRNGGMFTLHGYLEGVPTRISLKDCEIGVTAAADRNGQVFYSNTRNAEITLDGVKFDTSTSATKFIGCDIHAKNGVGAKITVKNGCDLKTGGALIKNYTDVTIDGSTLTSTVGRVLDFNGMSSTATALVKGASVLDARYEAICFQANTAESDISVTVEGDTSITARGTATIFAYKNSGKAKLTLGGNSVTQRPGYVVAVQECAATANTEIIVKDKARIEGKDTFFLNATAGAISIALEDEAYLNATRYGIYVTGTSDPVSIEAKEGAHIFATENAMFVKGAKNSVSLTLNDTAKITSDATGNGKAALFAYGNDANAEFNLTMNGNSSIVSQQNVLSFNNATFIPKATITMNGNSSVISKSANGFVLYNTPTTLAINDKAFASVATSVYTVSEVNTSSVITGNTENKPSLQPSQYPTMLEGATLRVHGSSLGLRFSAKYNKPMQMFAILPTYGIIITTKSELEKASEFTVEALERAGVTYVAVDANEGVVNNYADSTRTINAAIVNIKPENYGEVFVARAYAKYDDEGVTRYEYSEFDAEVNCGSVKDEAYEALADVKTEAEGDYKHEVSSYVQKGADGAYTWVNEKAYSKYCASQIVAIKAFTEDVQTGGNEA